MRSIYLNVFLKHFCLSSLLTVVKMINHLIDLVCSIAKFIYITQFINTTSVFWYIQNKIYDAAQRHRTSNKQPFIFNFSFFWKSGYIGRFKERRKCYYLKSETNFFFFHHCYWLAFLEKIFWMTLCFDWFFY